MLNSIGFFAEGNANVLFDRTPPFTASGVTCLLRVAKRKISHSICTKDVFNFHQTIPKLLGEEYVLSSWLVPISRKELEDLAQVYATSSTTTRKSELDLSENYAILVEKIVPIFEFKLKWTCQSPTAPKNATLCRTCAVAQMRGKIQVACPLDLASNDLTRIRNALDKMGLEPTVTTVVTNTLYCHPLLRKVHELEVSNYTSLAMKMVLRDMTYFVVVEDSTPSLLVTDYDPKHETKIEYWNEIERRLVDEGWYTVTKNSNCSVNLHIEPP